MSTKLSKDDMIKSLKSSGVLSDDVLSKVTGGSIAPMDITSVPCPYCHNVIGNAVLLMDGGAYGDGIGLCGGSKECRDYRPFYIIQGKGIKIEDYKKKIIRR